jgi:N-acetylgalactosamine kinase
MPAETIAKLARDEEQRASRLIDAFRATTGRPARGVVRAPGRVNLLGEHTDYNGLPVLPMAIDRSVLIALAPRADRTMRLFNTAARFVPRTYTLSDTISPYASGDWGNYSKAAAQELARHCGAPLHHGAELLVDGNIPSGAGLSSSSALVVANALALLAANDVELAFETLAELLPVAERYVGTLSGGMDQATSLLARAGHALRIDFFPLRVRTVPVPTGYSIVVCHSLVQAEKSGAAKQAYNQRVIECHLVCRVLDQLLGGVLPRSLNTLGDLAVLFPHRALLEFMPYLTAQLPERPLSLAEVATLIGTSPQRLHDECGAGGDAFALLRRARHVLSEAERVEQAEKALRAGDALAFGQLMDASHGSCRDDYEISCTALEELIAIAKDAGAVGARLTGAGFGGCTVNLVPEADVPGFLTRIDRYFYRSRLAHSERVGDYRFIFKPQAGAAVFRL